MLDVMLVDVNGVGYASNSVAKLTVGDYEVQAIFGTLNSIRELRLKNPNHSQVILWDGKAQWRYDLYPEYKANRTLDPNKKAKPYEIKQQAMRDSYKLQRPDIVRGLELLGVTQILPEEDEADDLAGHLSGKFSKAGRKILLVARDQDWLQLVDDSVSWYNPIDKITVTGKTFEEYTGFKSQIQFLQEKALLGDNSDNIKGVDGIGPKAAPLIINHYGSVESLYLLAKDGDWEPPIPELKRYRKKITAFVGAEKTEGLDVFDRNMKLMKLIGKAAPDPKTITVKKSPIDVDGFLEFCRELNFSSIINKQEQWLEPFMRGKK